MSETVEVPFGDNASDTAVLLLAAADDLDLPSEVVRTSGDAVFLVPAEVAKKAKVDTKDTGPETAEPDEEPKPRKPRKTIAKRTAKKSAAKK